MNAVTFAMPEAVQHLSDRHFRAIAKLIEGQVGIKLPANKRLMLEGRLHKRVRALNYSDLNEYVENLFEADHFFNRHGILGLESVQAACSVPCSGCSRSRSPEDRSRVVVSGGVRDK